MTAKIYGRPSRIALAENELLYEDLCSHQILVFYFIFLKETWWIIYEDI